MKKVMMGGLVALSSMAISGLAMAQATGGATGEIELSTLTDKISFANVGTALLAVGAVILTVYVGMRGIKWVIGMVKSA